MESDLTCVRNVAVAVTIACLLWASAGAPVTWSKKGASPQDFNDKHGCQKDAIALTGAHTLCGVAERVPDARVFGRCMIACGRRAGETQE